MSENTPLDEAIEALKKKLYKADGTLKSNASPADLARLEELTARKAGGEPEAPKETTVPDPDETGLPPDEPSAAEPEQACLDLPLEARLSRLEAKIDTLMLMLRRAGVIRERKFISELKTGKHTPGERPQ